MTRVAILAAVVLASLALAGCAGDGTATTRPAPSSESPGMATVARAPSVPTPRAPCEPSELLPDEEALTLQAYLGIDANPPKGGIPACIVGHDVDLMARVYGVTRVEVTAGRGADDTVAHASAVPDNSGMVCVLLHLPDYAWR